MDILDFATEDLGGLRVDPLATKRAKPASASEVTAQGEGFRYIISDEAVDLVGDVVVQAGLAPVSERIPAQVDHSGHLRDLIGWWSDITTEGTKTLATLNLLPRGTSAMADVVRRLHEVEGMRMACSIGFVPDFSKGGYVLLTDREDRVTGIKYMRATLLECSVVVVPAQPLALAERAVDARHVRRLMDSEAAALMRSAARGPVDAATALAKATALIAKANAVAH